ncbi:MAG: acetate--CoA ligase [Candidatus Berkelbacteria bacterium]|nr:acetate--CoA ligase [Candidatus Berkelbacteria bacterium]
MKTETYNKKKSDFRLTPNLEDYEKTYKTFSWDQTKNEVDWFPKNKLNIAYNAIDRHAESDKKNKVALYWENESGEKQEYTFWQLKDLSNQFANVLDKLKIKHSERVFIFLPRIPELYIAFLGTLKAGGVAGTLFQAFGPTGLLDRLSISGARFLVTNRELAKRVYEVKKKLPHLEKILIVDDKPRHSGEIDFQEEMKTADTKYKIAHMDKDDYAFELFTSGTTGKPKGVVHGHYAILQEHMTAKWVLDIHDSDICWVTADPGWVTGIAYGMLGSWSIGASLISYDGRFDAAKWYELLQKYQVSVWYTAPTAIRMLAKAGIQLAKKYDLSNLRYLASVGEPLNPEPIRFGLKAYKLPFHDNWWQTEIGGICIANYPCMDIKLGSMGKPFPGIIASIVDDKGEELPTNTEGNLALKPKFPSLMETIWRRPQKFKSYFKKGWYITGDRAYKDKDGYFWFIGRADDVIKTAGERVGPFEVESALIEHPAVADAGVIGKPDPDRGEIIKAFCVLRLGFHPSQALIEDISQFVKKNLAGHAYPKEIEFVDSLPKTRSGKIMRRVLKAKELGLPIGDTSTLEEY